jgi:hypothetical protein
MQPTGKPGDDLATVNHPYVTQHEGEDAIISVAEDAELELQVEIVEIGLGDVKQSFVATGRALKKIRDRKLYRKTDKTFEKFVDRRFGLSRSSAYNYIHAAENVQRAGHSVPAPGSMRAALAKTKKAVTLEAAKPELVPAPPHPALPAPPNDPLLTADEKRRRRWELRLALQGFLESLRPNHKIDDIKTAIGEDIKALLGDRAESFTVVPLEPNLDLMEPTRSV